MKAGDGLTHMQTGELKWLFLDMNAFFASVEQQLRPELRCRPVAVVPVMADSSCCIAASYEARSQGIKTGTRVSDARELCPDIHLVPARPAEYVKVHEAIVAAINRVIPVHKVYSIDEMACQLIGRERERLHAVDIGMRAKQAICEQVGDQLSSSVGISTNRFLAKTASNLQKPDGLSVIEAEDLPDILYRFELTDLTGIGRRMEARLIAHGIRSVEQLCALPAERLREIWHGVTGEWWWHVLRGHDMAEQETQRRTVGHSHVLPPQHRTQTGARAVMVKLIHKAAARLRKLDYFAGEISINMRYPGKKNWQCKQNITPSQDTQSLLSIFDQLWQQRPVHQAPLTVAVNMNKLTAAASMSRFLFPEDEKRQDLGHLMDEINIKFGPQSIYMATMQDAIDAAPMRIAFTKIPDVVIEDDAL